MPAGVRAVLPGWKSGPGAASRSNGSAMWSASWIASTAPLAGA